MAVQTWFDTNAPTGSPYTLGGTFDEAEWERMNAEAIAKGGLANREVGPQGAQANTRGGLTTQPGGPALRVPLPPAPPSTTPGANGGPPGSVPNPNGNGWLLYDAQGKLISFGGANAPGNTYGGAVTPQTTPPGTPGTAPKVDRRDPASVRAYVAYWATQPGANPSLARDPGYWEQKILSGELGEDPSYYVSKFMLPEGPPAGSAGTLGQTGMSGPLLAPYTGSFQGTGQPVPEFTDRFVPATGLDLMNDPGYLARMKMGTQAIERSAAARGTLLTPGTLQDLDSWAQDYGSNELGKMNDRRLQEFGTRLSGYNANLTGNQQKYSQAAGVFGVNYDIFRNNQNDPFNKLSWLTDLGYRAAGSAGQAGSDYSHALTAAAG